MRRICSIALITTFAVSIVSSCDTIKNLPTNTTGGVFSLNGTWRLSSTTDGTSMVGTTITVLPLVGNAVAKTLANNTYCVRENDQFWKNVKGNGAGGFTLKSLASACNGSTMYNDGTVAIVNNEKITVSTRTATNSELVQAWDRVKQ